MSSNNRDKDMPSVIQWDGTSGDPFKEWKRAILDTGAERTDESGSSVADVFTGADMGGTAVGAPLLPAGIAQYAQKMQALVECGPESLEGHGLGRGVCSFVGLGVYAVGSSVEIRVRQAS